MGHESAWLLAGLLVAALVAVPALVARRRTVLSREWSEAAVALNGFASQVRSAQRVMPLDELLSQRLHRLSIPELVCFELVCGLRQADPAMLAEAAQRLALRLKRRAAFERKMLARTAPGRRRGAIAAAAPALAMLLAGVGGVTLPMAALGALVALEILGCWMLWRVARVDV
jgi:hypothetical protein